MQRQISGESPKSDDLSIMLLAGSFGLVIGIASAVLTGVLVFSVLAAGVLVYIIIKRPELALLGILIATASIVFEDQLPVLSLGISLHIPDFLLLGSFGLIALRWFVNPEFKITRTPLDWPLLIFFGFTLIPSFISIFQSTLEVEEARRALRVFSYYLTFFIVTNIVRERRQLNFLLNGLFLLATMVAAAMAAQYLVGTSVVIIPGYVETLKTQGSLITGVTRILPPGVSIVLVSLVTLVCILVLERFKPGGWLKFIQIGLLGIAFLLTFLRSFLAALILVLSLLIFIFRGQDRQKLLNWGMVSILSLAIVLLFVSSIPNSGAASFVSASLDRYVTLFEPETFQGRDSSFNWRRVENEYAISAINLHPWIGNGVRFKYRPWIQQLDGNHPDPLIFEARNVIHNGHFLILLQSGFLGYLSFMWLSIAFLMRGFRYWRNVANTRMAGVVLGFTLLHLILLIAAATNSIFMQWSWTPVIGMIMGINEVILRFESSSQELQGM